MLGQAACWSQIMVLAKALFYDITLTDLPTNAKNLSMEVAMEIKITLKYEIVKELMQIITVPDYDQLSI